MALHKQSSTDTGGTQLNSLLELSVLKGRCKTTDIHSAHSNSSGNGFPMTDGGFHFYQHGRFGAMSEPEEGRHGHGLCQGSGIAGILGNPRFQRPFLVGERVEVKGRRQFPLAMGVVQESVVVQMVVNNPTDSRSAADALRCLA